MKCVLRAAVIFVSVVTVAQTSATKYVVLSPKSNIDMAIISQGFAKSCPNVVITENAPKADYILEAKRTTDSQGDSHILWHFALLNKDGNLLMATHFTQNFEPHFGSVCKYINAKAGQHRSSFK
jgi:hypothetical protein